MIVFPVITRLVYYLQRSDILVSHLREKRGLSPFLNVQWPVPEVVSTAVFLGTYRVLQEHYFGDIPLQNRGLPIIAALTTQPIASDFDCIP